jgi:replicative DNA helicase
MMTSTDLDKMCDQQAEQYVIGSCLNDYTAYPTVALVLKPDDFFIKRHEYIFEAMRQLHQAGEDIDVPTVALKLREMDVDDRDLLNEIGGEPHLIYLERLAMEKPIAYETFAARVKHLAISVQLAQATDKIKTLAFRQDMSATVKLNEAQLLLNKVSDNAIQKPTPTIGKLAMDFSDAYRAAQEDTEQSRLYTGYSELDNPALIGGFNRNNLVVIGADSGLGKTAVAVNFAVNFCKDDKLGLFVSKEMDEEEMIRRFMAVMSGIPLIKLRKYTPQDKKRMTADFINIVTMNEREQDQFGSTLADLQSMPLVLKHNPDPTPMDIWSEARRVKQMHGRLDFIVVDLITDMTADERDRNSNRAQELGNIAGRFKEMCSPQHLDTTAFVLSQVKPSIKQRSNKRPVKGDFQDSTAIGNQADVQLFLYRDAEYNDETEHPDQAELLVRKHRDGATGTAYLRWEGETTRLRSQSLFVNALRSKVNATF